MTMWPKTNGPVRAGRVCTAGLLVAMAAVLAGCARGGQTQSWDLSPGWRFADSLTMELQVTDTTTPHWLVLALRINPDYPFRNLWLRFHVTQPDGQRATSLREFLLAEADGRWSVEPNLWGDREYRQALLSNFRFQQPGTYRLQVVQLMRADTLPGVERLELRAEPMPEAQAPPEGPEPGR